jgi:hypothetical protein
MIKLIEFAELDEAAHNRRITLDLRLARIIHVNN